MPLTCSICKHTQRVNIEKDLLGKRPLRHIATQFGTSTGALQRHRPHISKALARAQVAKEISNACSVLQDVRIGHERGEELFSAALAILERATTMQDHRLALGAIRVAGDALGQARGYVELRAQITGELRNTAPQPEKTIEQIREELTQMITELFAPELNVIEITSAEALPVAGQQP
jgi:hypothetical protein